MNVLQTFDNEEFGSIRTVTINGEPWFAGRDVALALGYENPSKAIRDHVDSEDKIMGVQNVTPYITDNMGRVQYPTWINESGMYSLILSSKLPSAKRFKRWVTSEVLPALHRTGTYTMPGTETENEEKAVQRDITRDDYIRAATIVGSCKNERLPVVMNLLEQAGINIPKVEPVGSMSPHADDIQEFVERPVPYDWDEWNLQQRRAYWSKENCDEEYVLVPRRKICAAEVWCELFGGNTRDLVGGNNKSRDINKVLSSMLSSGWTKTMESFGTAYGSQRGFRKLI